MTQTRNFIQVGDRVRAVFSEPWEIHEAFGGKPFWGVVTGVHEATHEAVNIRLDHEIVFENKRARYFHAETRYVGSVFGGEQDPGLLVCNLISLTEQEGEASVTLRVSSLQERICAIGTLTWSGTNRITLNPVSFSS
jgi:hypothetical protein